MLTDLQRKLVELDKQKEVVKKYYADLAETLAAIVKEQPVGSYFQDEEGLVYKIVEPKGKYVFFEQYDYVRTKRTTEARGELSAKEAEAAGFALNK